MTFEVRAYEARTCSWWYQRREEIDFNPPYQRRGVAWDKLRQAFLVDSIVNGFDMPKLYLADFTYFPSVLNYGRSRFAVIDGKQRLSAVFAFLEDRIPLAPDFYLRDDPEAPLAGMYYSDIRREAPEIAARVENFNLPVMSVITDDERAVQELFVRLNSGKPLTAAERRNAMGGVVPELVREIVSSPFFTQCVSFSDRGGAHEQAAAKLILLDLAQGPVDLKRSQLDELYSRGEHLSERQHIEAAGSAVLETLDVMSQMFASRDVLLRTAGQVPVYYLLFRATAVPADVRHRIELFHQLRTEVQTVLRGGIARSWLPTHLQEQLSVYVNLMRNPNDARSVFEMYQILSWFVHVEVASLENP